MTFHVWGYKDFTFHREKGYIFDVAVDFEESRTWDMTLKSLIVDADYTPSHSYVTVK